MTKIPRSATESAIHQENQAAAKPEPKGILEGLRELWGVDAATLAGRGVKFIGEQLSNIGGALEHMGKDALAGVQREFHVAAFGKPDLGHIPPSQTPSLHDNAPVVTSFQQPRTSFDEIMKAQSEMAPAPDQPGPEQEQGPER